LQSRYLTAAQLQKLRRHLKQGGVIAYATESCFGLGCDPRNARAVRRILQLKGRPQSKGLILIAGKINQIKRYIAPLNAAQNKTLMQEWPGPTTFLLPAKSATPRWLRGGHDKIAVRVTTHADAVALCDALGMALVSTSANRSGEQPAKTYASCARAFGKSVMVLRGRIGQRKRPSTIKDLASGKIVRR